jgi:hypothetical protein
MIVKTSRDLMIRVVVLVALMAVGTLAAMMSVHSAFADNICIGQLTCSAIGGSSGRGGDTCDDKLATLVPEAHVLQVIIQALEMDVVVVQVETSLMLVVAITV